MNKSFFINTYGCQMNVHESEKIAGILFSLGYGQSLDMSKADIIVYNTCCIRETAETKVYGHLGKAKRLKRLNPSIKVILCGCLPQQPSAKEKLKRYDFIDLIIGTHNINLLGEYLTKLENNNDRLFEIWESEKEVKEVEPFRDSKHKAFINIMYGCNNFCSYCIVPYVRGRERSRSFDLIIKEVKTLIKDGYKEIMLLGQNVNSYLYEGRDFAYLLKTINEIEGEFEVKFMTSHPKDLSIEVIKTIADGKNLSKSIHLPMQSGNDRILKLMNRKYNQSEYLQKIEWIREYIPDCLISTDIIVGFPSETEEEFLDTLNMVQQIRFDNIFTFIYNRRSGTKADEMDGQIDEATKKQRIARLIRLQKKISGKE